MVELLVVMTIMVLLMGISAAGYNGLRTTMILKQSTENLRSDIMYAKRASMLIKRDSSENWIKGVGIDLASMHGSEPGYRIFKWCSNDIFYEDYEGEFSTTFNSVITAVPTDDYGTCEGIGTAELVGIPGYLRVSPAASSLGFKASPSNQIRFVMFETPTGKTRYYDCNGDLYEADQSVKFIYTYGLRAYEMEITTNGEINVGKYEGEVPESEICDGELDIFEVVEE